VYRFQGRRKNFRKRYRGGHGAQKGDCLSYVNRGRGHKMGKKEKVECTILLRQSKTKNDSRPSERTKENGRRRRDKGKTSDEIKRGHVKIKRLVRRKWNVF